jgi:hypothetical protein
VDNHHRLMATGSFGQREIAGDGFGSALVGDDLGVSLRRCLSTSRSANCHERQEEHRHLEAFEFHFHTSLPLYVHNRRAAEYHYRMLSY